MSSKHRATPSAARRDKTTPINSRLCFNRVTAPNCLSTEFLPSATALQYGAQLLVRWLLNFTSIYVSTVIGNISLFWPVSTPFVMDFYLLSWDVSFVQINQRFFFRWLQYNPVESRSRSRLFDETSIHRMQLPECSMFSTSAVLTVQQQQHGGAQHGDAQHRGACEQIRAHYKPTTL